MKRLCGGTVKTRKEESFVNSSEQARMIGEVRSWGSQIVDIFKTILRTVER